MSFIYGGISNKYIAYGCHYNGCYASYFCWQSQRWHRFACYLIDYLIIGYDILRKAIKGIKNRQVFDESFLMAVATIGTMALAIYENGEYLEAIAVMLFYQIGEWFQGYAVGKSRRNISNLMDMEKKFTMALAECNPLSVCK